MHREDCERPYQVEHGEAGKQQHSYREWWLIHLLLSFSDSRYTYSRPLDEQDPRLRDFSDESSACPGTGFPLKLDLGLRRFRRGKRPLNKRVKGRRGATVRIRRPQETL